ncbi:MAG: cytochrome c [Thermoanaerobaculia bacterium]
MNLPRVRTALLLAAACWVAQGCNSSASPQEIASGQRLYLTNGCAACHGPSGRGDGPVAATLAMPPRNFLDPASFRFGYTQESIAWVIATGTATAGGAMPAYPFLSQKDRRLVAAYILSLGSGDSCSSPPGKSP